MSKKPVTKNTDVQKWMIDFIIQKIYHLGERELDLVYRFVKGISE